jgi:YebC/PmpR family DNA-binding regulatory protein
VSGHSKWSTIKHKKGREDAKRGKIFSRLIKEITVAAKIGGGDPEGNPRLRTAIAVAKAENMPKANIENAIRRGTGELEGAVYEEISYEGYSPGGVAVLVEVLTDNKKRSAAEVRHIFSKKGGNLGETGCVSWMFNKKGLFTFDKDKVNEDELMEVALEAGAEDIADIEEDGIFEVYTSSAKFNEVREFFDEKKLPYTLAEISMIPQTTIKLEGKEAQQVLSLMEALEETEDVQNVYANFDIPSAVMEKLSTA